MRAADVIRELNLAPHPEGGHYREIYRDAAPDGSRGAATSIHYLLSGDQRSHWHRVTDAVEIWNFHAAGGAGAAGLELALSPDGVSIDVHVLGGNLVAGLGPGWLRRGPGVRVFGLRNGSARLDAGRLEILGRAF